MTTSTTAMPVTPATGTIADWWTNAERGIVHKGDTYIYREDFNPENGRFVVAVAFMDERHQHDHMRILHRARPAWRDAPAVMAHTARNTRRRAFVPSYGDSWEDRDGLHGHAELIDPAPMAEVAAA